MAPLLWIPGDGIDTAALARMRSHFPKPKEPMGEAWFMCDDRRMYTELLGDLDALDARTLKEPLAEIAGGTGSFGPHREWQVWFHHLLGATLPRCHET
jgi:hypothetical protein